MQEYEVIMIPVSDGTEKEFAIMDTFEVEEKKYMAVSLVEGDEIQEGIYLYGFQETEEGEIIPEQIADQEEYEKVADVYINL